MEKGESYLMFRVSGNSASYTIKYIDWGELTQEPVAKYSNIPRTQVFIEAPQDADCPSTSSCQDKRAVPVTSNNKFVVFTNKQSDAIPIGLSRYPASEVEVNLKVQYVFTNSTAETEGYAPVTITPSSMLLFTPWSVP